jgi:hypothetical protein
MKIAILLIVGGKIGRIKFKHLDTFRIYQFSWNMNKRSSFAFFSSSVRYPLIFTPDLNHSLPMPSTACEAHSISAPP